MLGSRFLGDPLAGGMPRWKYVSNRFLTGVENLAFGLHLSEYHTGLRAYSRHLLETIPYQLNSDDFVFDQELIAQVVAAGISAAHRRDRRPDPLLRGGLLGRLPAQRRVRPVDPAGGRSLPAPPPPPPALAQARRPRAAPTDRGRCGSAEARSCAARSASRSASSRSGSSSARSTSPSALEVLRTASPAWIARDAGHLPRRHRRARRSLAGPPRADRAAALPARARLHVHRLPRQQRPAGAPRRAVPEPRARRGRGRQPDDGPRHGRRRAGRRHRDGRGDRRGRGPRPERPRRDDQRGPARARLRRRCWSSPSGSGSPPIGCRARTGSPRSSPGGRGCSSWPAACARASRSPAGRGSSPLALAFSALAWAASTGTFLAAGQAVGVQLTRRAGGAADERRRAGLDRPVRARLRRHVRADRGGHRRRLRDPQGLGVRPRAPRPRHDPGDDEHRRRHRDARVPATTRGGARPRPGRTPSRRPSGVQPGVEGGEPAP